MVDLLALPFAFLEIHDARVFCTYVLLLLAALIVALAVFRLGAKGVGAQSRKDAGEETAEGSRRAGVPWWRPSRTGCWGRRCCPGTGDASCRVLVLGPDNAGKTAVCQALANGRRKVWPSRPPRPEHHVLHYEFERGGRWFHLIDPAASSLPPGRPEHRLSLWQQLMRSRPDAIMFVVDAADAARLGEAQELLHWALRQPEARSLPVLVLGNKIDLRTAVDTFDLKCSLQLAGLSRQQREAVLDPRERRTGSGGLPFELRHRIVGFLHPAAAPPHQGPLTVRMCSLLRQASLEAGLRWLMEHHGTSRGRGIQGGRRPAPPRTPAASLAADFLALLFAGRRAAVLPLYQA
eukprot:TRINITY_DN30159_c0_g1_i2.p1 TRINITY_DN30159_c0_g1~~TRINITY_DN30159_c0_g1_i2.p1  ORF type:complete len:349 (+),score=46.07 TRINITY_DN30159_c0_g1_i2:58-1104(+)